MPMKWVEPAEFCRGVGPDGQTEVRVYHVYKDGQAASGVRLYLYTTDVTECDDDAVFDVRDLVERDHPRAAEVFGGHEDAVREFLVGEIAAGRVPVNQTEDDEDDEEGSEDEHEGQPD